MADFLLVDNTAQVLAAMKKQLRAAYTEIGAAAVKHAQNEITFAGRVKTGALRSSIRYVIRDSGIYIGTNNKYAAFHELGTGKYTRPHAGDSYGVAGVHFLHHACGWHGKEYRGILERNLKR